MKLKRLPIAAHKIIQISVVIVVSPCIIMFYISLSFSNNNVVLSKTVHAALPLIGERSISIVHTSLLRPRKRSSGGHPALCLLGSGLPTA